jgi:hypothetical protein
MTDPTDTGDHHFTPDDVNSILGRVEPSPPDTVDTSAEARDDAHLRAQIQHTTSDVRGVLRRLQADPAIPDEMVDRVRFACVQAWNSGWFTRGLDRRTGQLSTNPFERPGGEEQSS